MSLKAVGWGVGAAVGAPSRVGRGSSNSAGGAGDATETKSSRQSMISATPGAPCSAMLNCFAQARQSYQ